MSDQEYEQEAAAEEQPEQEYADEPAAEQEYADEAAADDAEPEQAYEEPEQPAEPEPEPEPEYKAEPEAEPEQQYEAVQQGDLPANVEDACKDIYADNNTINWFSTKLASPSLKGANATGLTVDKAGTGGLNELKQAMAEEKDFIIFFLLRCNTEDDSGSSRAKFVYGRFVGTGVKFMQKAKLTPNLGAFADQFQVKHLSKDADEEMKGWTAEELAKEFLKVGGAHKPDRYNFGPGAVYHTK